MKSKNVCLCCVIAAACIVIGAVFKFVMAGYSFLAYGLWCVAFLIVVLMALTYLEKRDPKVGKRIKKIVYYCVFLFCVVLAVTEVIILSDARTDAEGEDYIIVLGAGVNGTVPSATLSWRLTAARDYLLQYPKAVCIVSGGQGPGEDITEAECMRVWLEENGIDSGRIIKEEGSSRTLENLANSKEIMDSLSDGKEYTVAIASSDFHLCRAKTLAYSLGMDTSGVSAKTKLPVLSVNYYFREAFALWNMFVFDLRKA